jgi:enoyl-CoA hydratase/carnithine racemase
VSLAIEVRDDHVGVMVMQRPPHNYLTLESVEEIARALESFDDDPRVRAAVLAADGKSFCAGKYLDGLEPDTYTLEELYAATARLVEVATPWVAAVHGPAVGGGLALALLASLRVTCPQARFCSPFATLAVHHGFGLTVTVPDLVGPSKAALVLLTGRRFDGEEATALGLADLCVPADEVRDAAIALAAEIARGGPLAIRAINRTLREGLGDRLRAAHAREELEQERTRHTEDHAEGVVAMRERRPGRFVGR